MSAHLLHTEFPTTGQPLRVVLIAGEPWFVVADVCRILGLANPRMAAKALFDDEKRTVDLRDTCLISDDGMLVNPAHDVCTRGNPRATATNTSGLCTLILRCRKPTARPFRDWVTRELLPSVRQDATILVGARLSFDDQVVEVRSDGSMHCPHGLMRAIGPRADDEHAPMSEPSLLCAAVGRLGIRYPLAPLPCRRVPVAEVLRRPAFSAAGY